MRIPRYWAWGTADGHGAFGWSDVSMEDAKRRREDRAKRIAQSTRGGQPLDGEYPYPNRPAREEIIQRDDAAGWAITRNCYGALVLNAANAMFIDIDLPETGGGLIGRLFGKKKPDPAQQIIEQTRQVVAGMSGMGARLYRTAGGFRVLITSEPYDPVSDLTHDLLRTFGSDQRYATLCKVQECFRARLTPKPWRCELPRPPVRFPYRSDVHAQKQAAWVSEYDHAIRGFSVCEVVEQIGNPAIAPEVEPILKLHDERTCCNAGATLA